MNPVSQTNDHSLNPKTLETLEAGLRQGFRIHAFRSGGGLRVVRLEDHKTRSVVASEGGDFGRVPVLKGYGEHPHVEMAMDHMAEDYLASHRSYRDQYSGETAMHEHYLTGSSLPSGPLDVWVIRGQTFEAYEKEGQFVFELHGYEDTPKPEGYLERAMKGETLQWGHRGYTYEIGPARFPNGETCASTKIVKSPEGKRSGSDPWMYKIVKRGCAPSLLLAITAAFDAPSVEEEET